MEIESNSQIVYRGFARQPCSMAGTIKIFCIRMNIFPIAKRIYRPYHATWLLCKTSIGLVWLWLTEMATRLNLFMGGNINHVATLFIHQEMEHVVMYRSEPLPPPPPFAPFLNKPLQTFLFIFYTLCPSLTTIKITKWSYQAKKIKMCQSVAIVYYCNCSFSDRSKWCSVKSAHLPPMWTTFKSCLVPRPQYFAVDNSPFHG